MNKYTATFADGTTVSRSSKREYGVAWRATWARGDTGAKCEVTGFARDKASAAPYRPTFRLVHRGMSANARADAVRENAAYLVRSGYRVEFADAQVGVA